jgi:hypothetical protein
VWMSIMPAALLRSPGLGTRMSIWLVSAGLVVAAVAAQVSSLILEAK